MNDPDFKNLTVSIIGLGLMGGSLALAIRDHAREIIGCDTDSAAITFALNHHLISRAADFDSALDCDLVILATPPRTIIQQFQAISNRQSLITNHQPSIILDLGSTKRAIIDEMQKLPAHFDPIGSHPMCGKEIGGITNADENLFRDKTFILSPLPRTSSRALNIVHQLIAIIGAQPLILEPDHHDSLAAMVSHLPYLTSIALMHSAMTMNDDDVWRIAASGFRDTTRLAASDLTMMLDIMKTNRAAVLESLHRFRHEIDSLTALIESSNFDSLHTLLSSAQSQRSQLFQLFQLPNHPTTQPPNHLTTQPPIMLLSPIHHPLRATVRVPGSKSLTNRALAIAALANGTTTITNALFSEDSGYFSDCLQTLGFHLEVADFQSLVVVHGLGGRIPTDHAELFVGNAGTAARFLTAFATLGFGKFVVDGNERMRERPIRDLLDALSQLGVETSCPSGCPPVTIRAKGLRGGSAVISGEVSSQFLSGLLMVAPCAGSSVEIILKNDLNSKPYVDMTIAVMKDFGVRVEREGYSRFLISKQIYQAQSNYVIESDASAASYFFAAPALLGGTVRVENISRQSKQGDIAFLDVLQEMGCEVREENNSIVVGASSPLHGIDIDMRDIPDTAQTLAAIAPFANSPTTIRGIASARVKETDRVAAMCSELRRIGVTVEEYGDGLKIYPCDTIRPATIQTYNDHRMAMAFSLIGLRVEGITIENPSCVGKTFPNYFETLETLRS